MDELCGLDVAVRCALDAPVVGIVEGPGAEGDVVLADTDFVGAVITTEVESFAA